MAVSLRLEKAFKRKPFLGKKDFKFVNTNDEVPIYKSSRIGIAFGGVDSTAVHEYNVDWSSYNTPAIHIFLKKRPLYFGHIFTFASSRKILPRWIEEIIFDVRGISTDWPLKYYSQH